MERNTKFLLFGVAGLYVYSLFSKAGAGKNIEVVFKTIKVLKPSGISLPTIQAIFSLQNPSSQSITINSLVGSLSVNGKYLANLTSFQKLTIPKNGQIDLPININAGLIDVIKTVVSLLKSKSTITANFDGNVNAEGFVIPVKQNISL